MRAALDLLRVLRSLLSFTGGHRRLVLVLGVVAAVGYVVLHATSGAYAATQSVAVGSSPQASLAAAAVPPNAAAALPSGWAWDADACAVLGPASGSVNGVRRVAGDRPYADGFVLPSGAYAAVVQLTVPPGDENIDAPGWFEYVRFAANSGLGVKSYPGAADAGYNGAARV